MDGVRGNSGESVVYGGGVVLTLASGVEIGPVWVFFVGGSGGEGGDRRVGGWLSWGGE